MQMMIISDDIQSSNQPKGCFEQIVRNTTLNNVLIGSQKISIFRKPIKTLSRVVYLAIHSQLKEAH